MPRGPSLSLWLRLHRSLRHRCSMLGFLLRLNGCLDRLIHLRVARAAAEIAAERVTNLFVGRIRIGGEQMFDCHHEPGSAVSALCAAPVAISLLNGGKAAVLADAFHGRDLL